MFPIKAITFTFTLLLPGVFLARQPYIKTTLGKARGVRETVDDNLPVDVFYGIPFAQPPIGDLRFRSPVSAEPWRGVLNATTPPNSCWQALDTAYNRFRGVEMWNPNTPRSEDCLYLNVFIPRGAGGRRPKPIMLWIFGGGFWAGTSTLEVYNGLQLAARNDVIVVTIGYRVGPFGFLYLGNEEVPGNAGLLDQAMAMQWVHDNAQNINGSPDDITIFGESAGAVSVGFHMLSPLTKDLFKNAIMQSASPICDWATQQHESARSRAEKLAESVSCPTDDAEQMLSCLRAADQETLSDNQWNVVEHYFDMTFGPVVDNYFLPDVPKDMVARGDIKITNVIAGVNKNEGIFFDLYGFMDAFPLDGNGEINREQFNKIMNGIVPFQDQVERVKAEYFKDKSLSYTGIIDAVSGDVLFKCPVVDFAQEYAALGGKVYMYSFEYRLEDNPWPEWMGVPHGYEVEVIFGLPLAPNAMSTDFEKSLSRDVMELWSRFAATGNPNNRSSVVWPEFNKDEEKYVVIDRNGFSVNRKLRHDQCAFWLDMGII